MPESFFCIEGNVAAAPEVGGETHVVLLGCCPQRLVLTTATTTSLISYVDFILLVSFSILGRFYNEFVSIKTEKKTVYKY